MAKAQHLLLNLLSIVFLLLAATLIVQNMAVLAPVQAFTRSLPEFSLGLLLLVQSILVAGTLGCKAWQLGLTYGSQQKRTSRELERKDVSREEAEAKVKVLENKVQTLEKALQEALKSKA